MIYENCLPGPDFAQLLFLSSISAFIVTNPSLGLEKPETVLSRRKFSIHPPTAHTASALTKVEFSPGPFAD